MKINNEGLELIKSFEGCKLKAYKCLKSEQYYTIGYGHYGIKDPNKTITQAEADELLKKDLEHYESHVNKVNNTYNYNFNENEFSALVSFAYNLGGIMQLTRGGTRTKSEIADAMLLYNKSGKTVLAGLTRRRKKERELFLKAPAASATNNDSGITDATTIGELIDLIIAGKFGNGVYRKDALYDTIQRMVNERVSK